jgi:hypothetical protein
MKGIIRRLRPSPAMVVACVALLFAMTGAGYAAGMLGPNTVGTKQLKKNAVISSKVKNRSLLAVDFKAGQLPKGAPGPQGPQGSQGPAGPAGPAGPGARWVVVSPTGAIAKQSGGIVVSKPQVGGYIVNFGSDVSRQLFLASSALINDGNFRGVVIASSCVDYSAYCSLYGANLANSVAVFTTDTTNGNQEDHSFYLAEMGPTAPTASVPSRPSRAPSGHQLGQ